MPPRGSTSGVSDSHHVIEGDARRGVAFVLALDAEPPPVRDAISRSGVSGLGRGARIMFLCVSRCQRVFAS
jgi:hypothetical protein